MRWSQALIRRRWKPETRRRCRSEGGWLRCSAAVIVLSGATQAAPGEASAASGAAAVPALIAMEIASTPDGDIYAIGDAITVSATFDGDVSVDVTHGRPSVDLTIGRHVRRATYVRNPRNARRDVVRFVYVVSDGDADEDGVDVPAGSVRLNRATVRDASKRDAVLEHEGLSGGAEHRVDGIRPGLVGPRADGSRVRLIWDEALDEGSIPQTHAFAVVFADTGAVVASVTDVMVKGRAADLTLDVPVPQDIALAVSYAPPGGDSPVIRDRAGNAGRAGTVETAPPTAAAQTDPEPAEAPRQRDRTDRALSPETVRQIEDILAVKAKRTPSQRKVGSNLLHAAREARRARGSTPAGKPVPDSPPLAQLVEVDIRADVSPEILERIRALGGEVVNAVPRYRAIRARLPLRSVETLAEEDEVTTIRTADQPTTHRAVRGAALAALAESSSAKENTSEGDVAHAADVARRTHGVDGTGIGIGVLSDGVGYLADRQASGDLPADVTVLAGQAGDASHYEGTAMLEIVHDLAPGASLYFATAFGSQAGFAVNIEALCDAGADVIVDDVSYFAEGVFQDDDVARAINAVVEKGCFYFSAAGNGGNLNDGESGTWEGDFAAGGDFNPDGSSLGTAHAFGEGITQDEITRDTRSHFFLKWADPLGGSSNDYDLFLIAPDGTVADSSTDTQDGTQDPVESIPSRRCAVRLLFICLATENVDHEGFRLVVVKSPDAEDRYLRLHTNRGRLAVGTGSATSAHNAGENTFGVAAVDARREDGTVRAFDGTEFVRSYSSDGLRRVFYEPDGTPITPGNFSATGGRELQKPDLAAADGVSATPRRFSDFQGTSAAAPHAAAIAALMLEAAGGSRNVTRAEFQAAMTASALDIEAPGVDRDSGVGIVMAPAAVAALAVPQGDRNRAPVASALADRVVAPRESITIDLAQVFTDPDGGSLTYVAVSDDDLVEIALSGSRLTLTVTRVGRASVSVRAVDGSGLSAVLGFAVSTGERVYDVDGDNLIEVASVAELDAMRYDLDGDGDAAEDWEPYYGAFAEHAPGMGCPVECVGYELADNLNFDANGSGGADAGDPYWNGGSGWLPIGDADEPFRAIFEGNGRRIANLLIRRPDRDDVGLFGGLGSFNASGVIRRLGMTEVDATGRDQVGGIAGDMGRSGQVSNSYVRGTVTGRSRVGGLAGTSDGAVANSYSGVAVSGETDVGGLVGESTLRGTVVSSYATGRVSGNTDVGGLVGDLREEVRNSYASGTASGDTDVGGLIGDEFASDIAASYWDTTTSAIASGLGEGLTTAELQTPVAYEGSYRAWNADGDDPWDFGAETDYPALKADLDGDGQATWQEFGHQIRAGPVLTVSAAEHEVRLTWTAPELSHWTVEPAVQYVVYRDAGDGFGIVARQAGLEYVDQDVTTGVVYSYQVAVSAHGGEAAQSAPANATPGAANAAPVAVGAIQDQTLRVGDDPVAVDVSGAFRDPDGDELSYGASSSASDVATVSISGAEVRIEAAAAGKAVVTVTATDAAGSNGSATQTFTVTVRSENQVDYDRDGDGLIEIATLAQLDAVRHDLDGDGSADESGEEAYGAAYPDAAEGMGCGVGGCIGYELDVDLDFDTNSSGAADIGDAYWNGSAGWEPLGDDTFDGRFAATFDGNGRLLANLFVSGGDHAGLFGAVGSSGVVRRVSLADVDVTGASYVGAVVGRIRQGGALYSSYAAGRVSGDDNVGGLVGRNDGDVAGCYATTLVSGDGRIGGLAGRNGIFGTIAAAYSAGRVSGNSRVGGLVGDNDGTVTASYATSRVTGERYVGGFAGDGSGDVAYGYWDTGTTGHAAGTHGAGVSTADLKAPSGYTGIYATWNVAVDGDNVADDPWTFGASDQYPALAADMDGDGNATWQEFGRQLREGPVLAAQAEAGKVVLTWTTADTSHWTPAPGVVYAVYRRDDGGLERIASGVGTRRYEDPGVDGTPAYQVAAVVQGGEATRSAEAQPAAPADAEAPAVESMISSAQHPTMDPFTVTITFSEAVTGLAQAEIDVANGTPGSLSGSDAVYAVTVAPDPGIEGDVTLTVPENAAQDAADNGNVAASESFAVDTRPPMPAAGGATVDAQTLTLVWTEPLAAEAEPSADVFTLTGGSVGSRTVSHVALSGSAATLTVSPPVSHGETGLALRYTPAQDDWIRDAVGNPAAGFSSRAVVNETPDRDAPTVASITSDAAHPAKDPFTVTIAFSEAVTGLTQEEIEVGGGTGSDFSGEAASYQLRVDPDPNLEGDVTVSVRADAAEDAAHNGNVAASETFAVDTRPPVLAIGDAARVDGAVLTLTWREPLEPDSTPAPGAFTVTGGDASRSVTGVSVTGSVVRLTVSPAAMHGEVGIRLDYTPPDRDPLVDEAGNPAPALDRRSVSNTTPDTAAPTVTSIASEASHPTRDVFRVTVSFSEPVTGLAASDIDVTGGTATGFSGSGARYGIDIEPDAGFDGDVTLAVPADAAEDDADNGNLAGSASFAVDTRPPGLAVHDAVVIDGAAVTLAWDEVLDPDSTPARDSFEVGGGTARDVSDVRVSGTTVHLRVDSPAEHGESGIEVGYTPPAQNPIQDALGNPAAGFSGREANNVTSDDDVPSVASITSAAKHPSKDPFRVTIVFSEAVSGLMAGEVQVVAGTGSNFSGSGATYALDIEADADLEGDVTVSVPDGVAEDAARNANVGRSQTFAVDTRPPTLEAADADGATVTLTWTELLDRNSVPAADAFSVSGGQHARSVDAATLDGDAVRLTISPPVSHGEQGITATYTPPAGNAVADEAGNRAPAFAEHAVANSTSDGDAPQVVSFTSGSTHPTSQPFIVTVVFSEAVTGFGADGIEVDNGDASSLTGSGTTYTLEVDPAAGIQDRVRITVLAGAARDAAGNGNESASAAFGVDTKAPAVDGATVDGAALTLTWSEPLDGGSTPPAGAFAVSGSETRAVRATAVSGNAVHLTVDPPAVAGEGFRANYDASTANPVRDALGNVAESFSDLEVRNETTVTNDHDEDDDGLIEVWTLVQLDAIRHDLDGDGIPVVAGTSQYEAAFPRAAPGMGCGRAGCAGYELRADLDFDTNGSGTADAGDLYWNDGEGWAPIGTVYFFSAKFDGNGHAVSNLFMDREGPAGLFGNTAALSVIRRVGLVAVDVAGSRTGALASQNGGTIVVSYASGRVSGSGATGGLVGWNTSDGTIRLSYATARVAGEGSWVGGLAGFNGGTVAGSYATGTVSGGGNLVGGLVGDNAGVVRGCYATGSVNGGGGVGGLVGRNEGAIAACLSTGRVRGVSGVGGLVGWGARDAEASYWDTETSAHEDGDDGAGRATAALQGPTGYMGLFAGWNNDLDGDGAVDDPWRFGTSGQYPALAADLDGDGRPTWQEFGYQLREGPVLSVEGRAVDTLLTWTAVDASHWNPSPGVTYAVRRDDEAIARDLAGLEYVDPAMAPEGTYQVTASVSGGEAAHSARKGAQPVGNRPPVTVGKLPDRTLGVGDPVLSIDVSPAFNDPDGDPLTYAAVSSASAIVTVDLSGSDISLTPVSAGDATVTVTATDTDGSDTAATQRFGVTVRATATVDYDADDDGLIEIASLAQLDAVRHDPDGDGIPELAGGDAYAAAFSSAGAGMGCPNGGCTGYELRADLDFDTDGSGAPSAGDAFWNEAAGWSPIREFGSVLEGNGRTISNLMVDRPGNAGLFLLNTSSGVVRRLGLLDVDVSGNRAGGLAAQNDGLVTGSHVTGRVAGRGVTGALVGWNAPTGTIRASYATARVDGEASAVGGLAGRNDGTIGGSYATGRVTGTSNVGGLVGANGGSIVAGYAAGSVDGTSGIGGLAGRNTGDIRAGYATGRVSGHSNVGGLVGSSSGGAVLAGYWDTSTSGHATGNEGEGLDTAALQAPTGYDGVFHDWNVDMDGDGTTDEPWQFGSSSQYPALAVDVDGDGEATWDEFGFQLREGPALTASVDTENVTLTWTAVDVGHWSPAPAVTYAATRGDDVVADGLVERRHVDANTTGVYQIVAVVLGGEASRSERVSTNQTGNLPPVAVGTLPDRSLGIGGGALKLDVAVAFEDPDGDSLTFAASSSRESVAEVVLSGSNATLTPLAEGNSTITVTATDEGGSNATATQKFEVTVTPALATDYDNDDDGLIDIRTLSQLDAVRYDRFGRGRPSSAGEDAYDRAFPNAAADMGCGAGACSGYELRSDLDFDTDESGSVDAADAFWNDGAGWAPIEDFAAQFDGNRHTIAHLFADRDGDAGLFRRISHSGVVERLGLVGVDVSGGRAGGLAASSSGEIRTSHASGRVAGDSDVGGLVGSNRSSGEIRASYAAVDVYGGVSSTGGLAGGNSGAVLLSYATGGVSGAGESGGLIGWNSVAGSVRASYAAGRVSGEAAGTGGLVGRNTGEIQASLATGTASGSASVGGLVGSQSITGETLASYWDTDSSGRLSGEYGQGETTTGLQLPTEPAGIYADWEADFDDDDATDDPWRFGTSAQYPALAVDFDGDGQATWQEFGHQLREGPTATVSVRDGQAEVTWTAVVAGHWSPSPQLTYTVIRGGQTVAENLVERRYAEPVQAGAVRYQVAVAVGGGEATRSAWVSTNPTGNRPPMVVGTLPDLTLAVDGDAVAINVSSAFDDPEGDTLSFGASSSAPGVAAVSVSDVRATITPVSVGTATVTVTAVDQDGSNTAVTQSFAVTVRAEAVDYDEDDDGLIEIRTLAQLDAVRHDRYGSGAPSRAARDAYAVAFPAAADGMGCAGGCDGYELRADLDFDTDGDGVAGAGDAYWNDGAGWAPIEDYNAVFDGNGHTLGDLFVDTDGDAGLFLDLWSSAEVRRLGLVGADVSGDSAGALAATSRGTVVSCFATGRVTGETEVGGLVGRNSNGEMVTSYATVRVAGDSEVGGLVGRNWVGEIAASYATGRVTGETEVGGLVGESSNGGVVASYATGRVAGDSRVGGLVGRLFVGEIAASYATGRVTGETDVGGLLGSRSLGEIADSYWDTDTSGQLTGDHGQGETSAGLQTPTGYAGIYVNWDADLDDDGEGDDPWSFGTDAQYPVLVADLDGDGQSTWEEFGHQLREGPALIATPGQDGVALTWTAVDPSHWSPAPAVTYAVSRDDATVAEGVVGLRYDDADATPGQAYTYQVAARVSGGEASRSARTRTNPSGNRAPVVATALPGRTLYVDGDSVTTDVSGAFEDPDGDALTFRASSSVPAVATVAIAGSVVTITPVTAGETTVTVTAVDQSGSNTAATQSFAVTVRAEAVDYDDDDDSLIEVRTLAQLDAVRHDRFGSGRPVSSGRDAYALAFPAAADGMGCADGCDGYELRADLDFDTDGSGSVDAGDAFWNDGAGWVPIEVYDAVFDGNGHTLGNLFVDRDGDAGLFSVLGFSAEARRLGLLGVDVSGDSAGALAATSRGSVASCYATGRVAGESVVGGLLGANRGGLVALSFATAGVAGDSRVGGLVGRNSLGEIVASYATGRVTGVNDVGGLVGGNSLGEITASYATGRVTGEDDVGGLLGSDSLGEIVGSYWDTDTSGRLSDDHGQGETTAGLQGPTGYAGIYADWDADLDDDGAGDDPWRFGTAAQYPVLAADVGGDGQATWQEFGHQLREGPALTATSGRDGVALTWTAVDASHWSLPPAVTYAVTRDDATVAEGLAGLRYDDAGATPGQAHAYQVAASVSGGEATRSGIERASVDDDAMAAADATARSEFAEPLTASFDDLPDYHDGATAFDFRIAFSDDIDARVDELRDGALTVSGGSLAYAAREHGRHDLWRFTVVPSGPESVSIWVQASPDCDNAGAICTAHGRPLANDLAGRVAYSAPTVAEKRELTASFEDVPMSHDGETVFELGVTFTEELRLSVAMMRDYAFEIVGGDILQATRPGHGSNRQWAITVEPDSVGPVTIKLPATTDCEAMGAVCTENGRPLSNASAATVAGPAPTGAWLDGAVLALAWPTRRDGFAAPAGADFAVHVGGRLLPVASASLRTHGAVLALSRAVRPGEAVLVDYLGSGMHPLRAADGGRVPAWRDLTVSNLTDTDRARELPAAAPFDAGWRRSVSLAGAGLADGGLAIRDLPANLRRLDLSGNALTDLWPVAGLRELESLDLSDNSVVDLAPLAGLTSLRRLDLAGNRIDDLGPLAGLPALEVLLLDGNRVVDAGALMHFGRLENLGLSGNRVAELEPLSDLWSLRRLDLGGNPARDLSPLGDLETLVWLRVPSAGEPAPAHRLARLRWLLAPTGAGVCLACGKPPWSVDVRQVQPERSAPGAGEDRR